MDRYDRWRQWFAIGGCSTFIVGILLGALSMGMDWTNRVWVGTVGSILVIGSVLFLLAFNPFEVGWIRKPLGVLLAVYWVGLLFWPFYSWWLDFSQGDKEGHTNKLPYRFASTAYVLFVWWTKKWVKSRVMPDAPDAEPAQ
jgi:hypothetical protein